MKERTRRVFATIILLSIDVSILYYLTLEVIIKNASSGESLPFIFGNVLGLLITLLLVHQIAGAFLAGLFALEDYSTNEFWYFLSELSTDLVNRNKISSIQKSKFSELLKRGEQEKSKLETKTSGSRTTEELERIASDRVAAGNDAATDGELQHAIIAYEEAIDQYEQAKEQSETETQKLTFKNSVAKTQNKLSAVRERKARLDAVRNPLENAESSFQTAIAQHAQNERTPARRDYRQATDQYDRALAVLDETETDMFEEEGEITVSVQLEAESLPGNLSGWDYLSADGRDALSDAGIDTLSDVKDADEELIQELVDERIIAEELANRLRAAKWWHGESVRTFTSRAAIERQRDCAARGHQILS